MTDTECTTIDAVTTGDTDVSFDVDTVSSLDVKAIVAYLGVVEVRCRSIVFMTEFITYNTTSNHRISYRFLPDLYLLRLK